MKRFLIACIITIFFVANPWAYEISDLLQDSDWYERDKAVSMIRKDLEKYQNDTNIHRALLQAVKDENQRVKLLRTNRQISSEHGRGEYNMDLIDLIIDLDIPESTAVLIESAVLGNKIENAIVDSISESNEPEKILQDIKSKMISSELYYKGNRSSYIRVIKKYLDTSRGQLNEHEREITKEIVLNGLTDKSHHIRKNAIRCGKYFIDDVQVVKKLNEIANNDQHVQVRNGIKTYPLREESRIILNKND